MMNIAIYTLTSELHDKKAENVQRSPFSDGAECGVAISDGNIVYDFRGSDYADYGSHPLDLIYVQTGGTEGIFKRLLPKLRQQSSRPFYLLTSGKSNSLAASMEILSFLRQNGLRGEIIHGSPDYIARRIRLLEKVGEGRERLRGCRLGIIGEPSDWLISSGFDRERVKALLGIELMDIPMQELLDELAEKEKENVQRSWTEPSVALQSRTEPSVALQSTFTVQRALPGAMRIYDALKVIVERYGLQGFTIRCFDLLTTVHNTGCLALAKMNAEGIVAGCEGDVPAMLSMMIVQSLLGVSGFQANPASIDPSTGEMVFAHCTIPFNMVERYEMDTHFESGIGVGIRGYMKEGPVTIFKVSGSLDRHFAEEGYLIKSQAKPDLCRTQQVIRLSDKSKTTYFLTEPIGNHHIIVPGHHRQLLEEMIPTGV